MKSPSLVFGGISSVTWGEENWEVREGRGELGQDVEDVYGRGWEWCLVSVDWGGCIFRQGCAVWKWLIKTNCMKEIDRWPVDWSQSHKCQQTPVTTTTTAKPQFLTLTSISIKLGTDSKKLKLIDQSRHNRRHETVWQNMTTNQEMTNFIFL